MTTAPQSAGTADDQTELWLLRPWPSPMGGITRISRRHEEEGWDGLLLADAHTLGPDPFVSLGAAATATSTLKLGTGVTNPVTRMAGVLATAMMTVQALSGGRAVLGIGRGDGALAPLGMRPAPVARFEEYLDRLQAYLSGGVVCTNGVDSRLQYLDAEPIPKVPLDVAATGPRMLGLAAVKADIVSCAVGGSVERARRCRDLVQEARADAGLDPYGIVLSCYVPVAVTGALSREQARQVIRASTSIFARFSAMEGAVVQGVTGDEERYLSKMAGRYRGPAGHPTFSAATVIDDDEFIDGFAVVGTPAQCAERLHELGDLGFTRLILVTRSLDTDVDDAMSARVAETVLPLLR